VTLTHRPVLKGFDATVEPNGRVTMEGELDITSLGALRTALDQALIGRNGDIAIDATFLSFIDSAGLTELLRYQLLCSAQQRLLFLDGISAELAWALEIHDLSHILSGPGGAATPTDLSGKHLSDLDSRSFNEPFVVKEMHGADQDKRPALRQMFSCLVRSFHQDGLG
jgi:anti-anti-sigma factor